MTQNLTLREIANGHAATERVAKLEAALRALLVALDTQYLDNRPPGTFHYSGNVADGMRFARSLVPTPVPEPPAADIATTCSAKGDI